MKVMQSLSRFLTTIIHTYRGKFILLAFFVSFIPMGIITVFTYALYREDLFSKVFEANRELLSVVDWNIESIARDINEIADFIISTDNVQSQLNAAKGDPYQELLLDRSIRQTLTNIINSKKYIDSIFIGSPNRSFMQYGEMQFVVNPVLFDDVIHTTAYRTIAAKRGQSYWFPSRELDLWSDQILYGRLIRNINNLETIGVLLISIRSAVFDDMFRHISEGQSTAIAFIDQEGRVVYTTVPHAADMLLASREGPFPVSGNYTQSLGGDSHIITYARNESTGWSLVAMLEQSSVLNEALHIIRLIISVALISFLFAMIGAFFISKGMTRQLSRLKTVLVRVGNKEPVNGIRFRDSDEVGEVGNEFLRIVKQNAELNVNLYQAVLKEKEAELAALQSQINPHFLYNTLDTIYWMAYKEKQEDIAKMILALSNMFKLSLNKGSKFTTVKDELMQLENYISIQKIRFKDKITYAARVASHMLDRQIIKFILQPIVENAVHHGLELKEGPGSITLTAEETAECLTFLVEDDGIGFDVSGVLEQKKGYGLRNIEEQIKLWYGESYGITITSIVGSGTAVEVRLGKHTDGRLHTV